MGIEADKEEIGSIVWVDRCKFAQDRANAGDHNTSDIGVLWAEDKIATLTAEHIALAEAAREVVKGYSGNVYVAGPDRLQEVPIRSRCSNGFTFAVDALAALIGGGDE